MQNPFGGMGRESRCTEYSSPLGPQGLTTPADGFRAGWGLHAPQQSLHSAHLPGTLPSYDRHYFILRLPISLAGFSGQLCHGDLHRLPRAAAAAITPRQAG